MAGRYLPPALRNKQQQLPQSVSASVDTSSPSKKIGDEKRPGNGIYSLREIYAHFWNEDDQDGEKLRSDHNTTLHSSSENTGLAWALLFHDANPQWESNRIIFVKSSLHILPDIQRSNALEQAENEDDGERAAQDDNEDVSLGLGLSTAMQSAKEEVEGAAALTTPGHAAPIREGPPVSHPPFAIFAEQTPHLQGKGRDARCFKFIGWHKIARMEILLPKSEALVRMLTKKWEKADRFGRVYQRQRNQKAWDDSLNHKWAILKMVVDEEACREKGEPKIERIERKE
jgi:hypothetical protein